MHTPVPERIYTSRRIVNSDVADGKSKKYELESIK